MRRRRDWLAFVDMVILDACRIAGGDFREAGS
jgi:hypothetical protein